MAGWHDCCYCCRWGAYSLRFLPGGTIATAVGVIGVVSKLKTVEIFFIYSDEVIINYG